MLHNLQIFERIHILSAYRIVIRFNELIVSLLTDMAPNWALVMKTERRYNG